MKINKTIYHFILLITLALCVTFTSCKTTNTAVSAGKAESVRTEVEQNPGASVPEKGIPTLAWYGVKEHTVERYLELKECGIDYNLTFCRNVDELAIAMDAADAAGVKMIIYCPELHNQLEVVVNRFKNHPALVGYHIIDEPTGDQFSHWGELARRIQAVDNEHFCYVNLLSSTDIQSFLAKVPVSFLSFDHYPIRTRVFGIRSINNKWYQSLEIFSDEACKAGMPFWAFALATAHWSYPIPTLADLRLQVYSNLAYGAQGIQYFTYWTPSAGEGADFHSGPIDYNTLQKTATWYTVRQMNGEIKALSSVFLGAQVIQVRHIVKTVFGTNGTVPKGTTQFNFAQRPVEANIIKTFTIPKSAKAVVSFLKNGNRCYMVVVNRNLSGGADITFTITGDAGLQLIQKNGTAIPASEAGSSRTVTPGDVLIYGWNI